MAVAQMFVVQAAALSAALWIGVAPRQASSANECVEALENCSNPIAPATADIAWDAVVVGAIFLGVLVFGLRAIKRQRDEGRRSKLPPIG